MTLEICIENLTGNRIEKLTPKMVRRLLGIDNKEIAELCRKISLVPKRDERGQTYFSKEDVDVLQKIKQLHAKADAIENTDNVVSYRNPSAIQKMPETFSIPVEAVEPVGLSESFASMEQKLIDKISKIIDDKLDGMDEVVVELIRCKTENETLRQKVNEQNKQIYNMKNELNSYRPIGFSLYTKQKVESFE